MSVYVCAHACVSVCQLECIVCLGSRSDTEPCPGSCVFMYVGACICADKSDDLCMSVLRCVC